MRVSLKGRARWGLAVAASLWAACGGQLPAGSASDNRVDAEVVEVHEGARAAGDVLRAERGDGGALDVVVGDGRRDEGRAEAWALWQSVMSPVAQGAPHEEGAPSGRRPRCLANGCGSNGVWVESREGFVQRFAWAEVRDSKLRKEKDPTRLVEALLRDKAMKVSVFEAPVVELAAEGKTKAMPVYALAARVYARAGKAVLRLSVNGQVALALNGKTVHEEGGDQYLLTDHRSVPVELEEGWNTFAIRLEKLGTYAVKFAMRLRAADGAPLAEVGWDVPLTGEGADPCAPLSVELSRDITEAGWSVSGKVLAKGLMPAELPKNVGLFRDKVALASVPFDMDQTETRVEANLGPDDLGAIALEVDGVRCEVMEGSPMASGRKRWLELRGAVRGLDDAVLGPRGRESLDYVLEDIRGGIVAGGGRRLDAMFGLLEREVAHAKAGRSPFQQPGLHLRAYRSDYDGTLQRYVILVPQRYGMKAEHPLVVLAHGLAYTPEDMMRIAFGKPSGPGEAFRSGALWKWNPPEPPGDAIVVAHDGYGNAGQRPPGEVDVRRVIDEVKAAYRVDARRVSISGFSLGGSVSFWVPFHAASVFSAAAPLCGYPNLDEYGTVRAAKKKAWEGRLLEEEGVMAYLENGKYLPLWMVHGSQDGPRRSELVHDRYKALDYRSDLEVLQAGHNVWDETFEDDKLLKSLVRAQRPEVAPKPVLRSGRYRWAENFWLRIDRFEDEGRFGELSGRVEKGKKQLEVSTKGVTRFTLVGSELGVHAREPREIVVDKQSLGEHVVGEGLTLSFENRWKIEEKGGAGRAADGGFTKRAGVEGPIGDVWFGPALVIYGTAIVSEIEVNRLAAERHRMHSPWIDLRLPVKADTEVTEADLVGRSLVLIGRPASNLVTRRIEKALGEAGIRFVGEAIELGEARFEGADVGISVIRPSPFDADRYVVLHAGVGPEGTLSSRYLPEFGPDYLVYEGRMRATFGDRILGRREVLAGGFFDAEWRLVRERVGKGER